ncbi:MAG TPA: MiaB/RimO family radical SAM methylthiotransferase [Anaerolineaceae bacterium]|nr:MiaB/RimO family radical SAM methylthiotransferase [Anaerolineaceae bacterium]HOR83345.1 MiaB/RimO family radical SAM methylthiotransferase [Anaerolineaceae bacterium]HPL42951.1 MiaB/RimO family radical SAM methylthiotransferase [Anaerolineaceae bacterium]
MRYYIWTAGCQMNVADSRRLARSLENLGCEPAANIDDADIIVLNTCVVRQSAEDKAIGRLSSLKSRKKQNPDLVINLMGCLVGVHGNPALQKRFPWVDVFSAPSDPQPLLDFLANRQQADQAHSWRQHIDSLLDDEFGVAVAGEERAVSENLPVVLGCSHACAYCVIPLRRGRERSRDAQRILRDARTFASQGVREIVLLGQIIDRYGLDLPGSPHLPQLLASLSEIPEIIRLRFLTSHPNWMSDELIDSVARLPKVMPHIEVPAQAGDDGILLAMRRGYTNQQYRDLVAKLRDRIPGVSIATDIIVGFPGETEAAFQNTYDLLADLRLDVAHLARYSPRPGTYSARELVDSVPAEEKMRRFRLLEDLQEGILRELNQPLLGTSVPVLFEYRLKGRWYGRTPTNRIVFTDSEEDLTGMERQVKIDWTGPWSLVGSLEPVR